MSLKNLFDQIKSKHLLPGTTIGSTFDDVESDRYIDAFIEQKLRFEPHIDYTTASNFVRFGLAQEYYDVAIKRIYTDYPYDGSSYEKLKWINESNGLDLYVFHNEYPRTNGYAKFSPAGWGSRTSLSGNYANPATKEYIYIKGGPNVDNIWHTASNRTSNLEIDGYKGNTVEFWLKKDGYQSLTNREVVLDVWTTGAAPGDHKYGRLTIELDRKRPQEDSPWVLTYQSGTAGVKDVYISGASGLYASASDGKWHHYAFAFQNTGSQVNVRSYVDGVLNSSILTGSAIGNLNTALIGTIGSLAAPKDTNVISKGASYASNAGLGFGKLSGSLDEFRFWKAKRSSKDIGRHWNTQVHGGTNTDDPNTDLGIYYKFNEGITLTSSIDNVVLDYSGRISNGAWTGYSTDSRSTKSAIVQSSASLTEFKDPIIHVENPRVNEYMDKKNSEGAAYDHLNNSCLFYSMPDWITSEDGEGGDLRKLTQIMGSYFDSLFLQIESLATLKHIRNKDYKHKPIPFRDKMLRSMGLYTPEIFIDADVLASLSTRDNYREFEQKLHDVKNVIYRNIYNNLSHIYKSKGTEKAFRNMLRCYGIDEELVKINVYADKVTYPLEQKYRTDSYKKKYANFSAQNNHGATVYQYSSSFSSNAEMPSSGFITGSHAGDSTIGLAFTTEAEVVFPYRRGRSSEFYDPMDVTSSLFGGHTVPGSGDITWPAASKDFANFQVYAAKHNRDSKHVKFIIKSRTGVIPTRETKLFYDVYENKKWNLAVRVVPKHGHFGSLVSGSTNNGYNVEFYGVHADGGEIVDQFLITSSITTAQGERFNQFSKRLYIGASRQNFTGSLYNSSDVRISSFRHWASYLDNETIQAHAKDPKSYGVNHPLRNPFATNPGVDNDIPTISTLALNWDFSTVTGSTAGGQMFVEDFSSGSSDMVRDYGWVGDIVAKSHPGRGDFFLASSTSSVDVDYIFSARQQLPENIYGSDMIRPLTRDDVTFTRESSPISHYFAIEKSMYQTVSEEMLDMFATIKDFSNLIGEPVNRYRPQYKSMEKLRQLFFTNVQTDLNLEKYVEFYKWIDSSLSIILDQLKPATANFSEDVRTMIESHILERNKYWTKYPTLEMKNPDPEGHLFAINELMYNWKYGHAPLEVHTGIYRPSGSSGRAEDTNCLWWQERASRNEQVISSGQSAVDTERETLRQRGNVTHVSGATYAVRRLTRPVRLNVDISRNIHGGDNYHLNKKKDFFLGTTNPNSTDFIRISGSDISTNKDCSDVYNPRIGGHALPGGSRENVYEKRRLFGPADISDTGRDHDLSTVAPFSLYSSSIDAPVDYKAEIYDNFKQGVDITNLHSDAYGDDREIPMQSPFTEYHVGGHMHRHQEANFTDGGKKNAIIRIIFEGQPANNEAITLNMPTVFSGSVEAFQAVTASSTGDFHNGAIIKSTHQPVTAAFMIGDTVQQTALNFIEALRERWEKSGYPQHRDGELRRSGWNPENKAPYHALTSYDLEDWVKVAKNSDTMGLWDFHEELLNFPQTYPANTVQIMQYVGGSIGNTSHSSSMANVTIRGFSGGQDSHHLLHQRGDRKEAFFITMSHGELYIINPDMEGTNFTGQSPSLFKISMTGSFGGRANILREPLAKRPVNIRNIKSKVGVRVLGNYTHDYEQVMCSVDSNPVFLVRTGSVEELGQTTASIFIQAINDRVKLDRPVHKNAIVSRFSAPGGPLVAGDALGGYGLDPETNQYSHYNNLNFRNLSVRYALDAFQQERSEQFGYAKKSSITSSAPTASYHKVNRNTRYVVDDVASPELGGVLPEYDNTFVSRPIPQSDLQYAWIKYSTTETTASYNRYESEFTYPTNTFSGYDEDSGTSADLESPTFISSSELGIIKDDARTLIRYGQLGSNYGKFIPTDFVGLNTVILERLTASSNTLGAYAADASPGGLFTSSLAPDEAIYNLNHLILNRQGPYGWPSWKQMRVAQHPIARHLRKTNVMSFALRETRGRDQAFPSYNTFGNYSWPDNIRPGTNFTSRRSDVQRYRFTESAVTSRHQPIERLYLAGDQGPEGEEGFGNVFLATSKFTYANNLITFSNKSLVNFLAIDEEERAIDLSERMEETTTVVKYTESVYPKDENSYLAKARQRQNFQIDWWDAKRKNRKRSTPIGRKHQKEELLAVFGH